ncbi:MAG: hypothetical protein COW11_03675, partial [Candidatus Omnitrophica bacterium CG12_big_fil_rev_8_21_14_0_65_43_15]
MLRKKISGFAILAIFLFVNCAFAADSPRRNIFQRKQVTPVIEKKSSKANIKPVKKTVAKSVK